MTKAQIVAAILSSKSTTPVALVMKEAARE
jgi:hypothetical protein